MSHSVGFWLEYVSEYHTQLPSFPSPSRCFPVLPVHSESQPKDTIILELCSGCLVFGSNLEVHSFTPKAFSMLLASSSVAWCFDVCSCAMADMAVYKLYGLVPVIQRTLDHEELDSATCRQIVVY